MRRATHCCSFKACRTRFDLAVAAFLLLVSQVEVWRFGVAGGGLPGAACLAAIAIVSAWRTRFPLASAAGSIALAFVCAAWAGLPGSVTFASATILAFYRIGTAAPIAGERTPPWPPGC